MAKKTLPAGFKKFTKAAPAGPMMPAPMMPPSRPMPKGLTKKPKGK